MKKIFIAAATIGSLLVLLTGCTDTEMTGNSTSEQSATGSSALGQSIARDFGGTTTIELEPNLKLEEITWKDDDLWYLTRPMREDEEPETHTFIEKGGLGTVFDGGTVIVVERKE